MSLSTKNRYHKKSQRVRRKLRRISPDLFRLSVYRSGKHIYAQLIDDSKSITLASASSLKLAKGSNIEAASEVGKVIATQILSMIPKINVKIKFDRGRYKYHGRVKALADAARQNGLEF